VFIWSTYIFKVIGCYERVFEVIVSSSFKAFVSLSIVWVTLVLINSIIYRGISDRNFFSEAVSRIMVPTFA
jgi:hypothetical protein